MVTCNDLQVRPTANIHALPSRTPACTGARTQAWKHDFHPDHMDTLYADVASELTTHYSQMVLLEPPRWLLSEQTRQQIDPTRGRLRAASSIIIKIQGTHTMATLGIQQFTLRGRLCRIDDFFSATPRTLCRNCFSLGHATERCANLTRCGVCSKAHHVDLHNCTVIGCRQGRSCNHGAIKCTLCNSTTHRALDPACPTRVKAAETARSTTAPPPLPQGPIEIPEPLVKLCVQNQASYRHGKKAEFWAEMQALSLQEEGVSPRDPGGTMRNPATARKVQVKLQQKELGTVQSDTEPTQAVDQWTEAEDRAMRAREEAKNPQQEKDREALFLSLDTT